MKIIKMPVPAGFFLLLLFFSSCIMYCGKSPDTAVPVVEKEARVPEEGAAEIQVMTEPLTFRDVAGKWTLLYPNDYGYEFQFFRNYSSLTILYLNNHALLFKGVYTIEEGNRLRLNIYEMKRSKNVKYVNKSSGFLKAKSSYFLFQCSTAGENSSKRLILRPIKIIIDGNSSDGYFEPIIKLKKH